MRFVCFIGLLLIIGLPSKAQLLRSNPIFITDTSSSINITCDATRGNQGLLNYTPVSDVYVHIGCITTASSSSSDWKYSKFTWGTTTSAAQCVSLGNNQWKYSITGGLRSFFGITNSSEKILRIAILFRNGSGGKVLRNADGSDMYLPVTDTALQVRIMQPFSQPTYTRQPEPLTKNVGDTVTITANANQSSNLKLYWNGSVIAAQNNAVTIAANTPIISSGMQTIVSEATNSNTTSRDTFSFYVATPVTVAALPAGVKDGINYEPGDTSLTLVLFAPLKNSVSVVGDFNNWTQGGNYQMNRTPDGNRFWLRITGLTPKVEYAYQYIIDGTLKVADYNTEKILDPVNDPGIPAATYPSLKSYPTGKTTGIVSIIQTGKAQYNWQVPAFTKPNKQNLVIYELLVRDFIAAQNWQTLKDTLSYIKRLGVNAIELMPFSEFEGNSSWGYNPIFYFAPDKAYGTETALKQFIDECHKQGMAVIMDLVMNHSFGQSPMVQMYWDAQNNRPAANSPWFNPVATHPYSVGYDFNHASQATKDFVDRVTAHWMLNYKIDGFRWDLSKGFTQTNNPNDVAAWSAYDSSRIAIWKRIYDQMQATVPGSYCILEHFAANQEEIDLSNYGMLLWGNANYNFNQATMGFATDWNFQWGIYQNRSWSKPNLVTYMESHDEERLMYKNLNYGNAAGAYSVKDLNTALKRNEMAAAFWAMIPGPKLLWQFGELGYDYSINQCQNATIDNSCRTSPKPIHWEYATNSNRLSLYNVYAQLIKLRLLPAYTTTFTTGNLSYDLSGAFKWLQLNSDSLKVMVLGNFDVNAATASISFPSAGTWYNYLTDATYTAPAAAQSITLQPGEYYVFTNKNFRNIVVTAINEPGTPVANNHLAILPNPVNTNGIIEYEIPASGKLMLDVWDLSGKRMTILEDAYKTKGFYRVPFNRNGLHTGNLAAGTYLLRMLINGKQQTIPFIMNN